MDSPTTQSWGPPKHPLPPHQLARLANALGVSTPMPAIHTPSPLLSPSYNGSSPSDPYRRSPTPSTASSFGFAPSTSKFLLHVIPPIHLPHDTDSFDSDLTPPPSNASGYHTQFRRGTLVPVHSTLQSQLGAIAKEYALPSTSGLVLYLVSQRSPSSRSPPPSEKSFGEEMDEPGPRLSEHIWRHLWTRVVKTELRDEGLSLAPPLLGLGLGGISSLANRSTPYLNHTHNQNHAYPLPLLSTNTQALALTPSPTTPSSTSDMPSRFATKSAPPSSSSRSPSDDAIETPDTSQAASDRADSLDLPGLHSDALIPILAKVEFDIDRRKAGWYEPWLRSRRMNHAKRAAGRKNSSATAESSDDGMDERDRERRGGQQLAAFRLKAKSSLSRRYLPLSESPNSMLGSDSEGEGDADGEGTDAGQHHLDPLADVFGDDADTWADMRANRHMKRPSNPHVVQLALSAAELGNGNPDEEDEDESPSSDDDVRDVTVLMGGAGTSPGGMGSRRRAPAPLVLASSAGSSASLSKTAPPQIIAPPLSTDDEFSSTPEEGQTRLPYLKDLEGEEYDEGKSAPRKSMYDPGKRRGDIYEDMDLGFAVDDLDVDDPNDHRKSQVIMHAQLNEIEKNLAQFSPRKLRTELDDESPGFSFGQASPHLSPAGRGFASQTQGQYARAPVSNADVFPPTPRLPNHPDVHPERDGDSDDDDLSQAAWPAVPFSSLPDRERAPGERSPPRLAVNGVSASMPKRFRASTSSRASTSTTASVSESELRKRDLEQLPPSPKVPVYPALTPLIGAKSSLSSPLIPLSPDPFGRHPSSEGGGGGPGSRQSASYWDPPAVIPASIPAPDAPPPRKSSNASSRFSTDSLNGAPTAPDVATAALSANQAKRSTIMSVKTIKKLWRKSNKNSVSSISTVLNKAPMEAVHENVYSPLEPPPPQRPNRPSMEDMDLPDVGDVGVVVGGGAAPRTPITGSFPGTPITGSFPGSSSSASVSSGSRRPSTDVPPVPQLGAAGRRPSVGERRPVHSQAPPPPPMGMGGSQSHMPMGQLSVPPPMLRSTNSAPIVPRMAAPKQSTDGLHWDQESPYPTRALPSRAPSASSSRPPSRPPSAQSNHQAPSPPNTSSPPTTSSPPNTVRKSILKWKSATGNGGGGGGGGGAVPAPLTPSASTFRTHKATLSASSLAQGSPMSLPLDIPPSPKIPDQFMSSYVGSHAPPHPTRPNSAAIAKRRMSAKMASTSTDGGTSLDTSGFEIVSPKMGGALSFPYHELDHDRPFVDGVRM
ncbi:hypothetical protein B0H16DRAFT_1419936 [Mycena metata]|uniref:Uncharacterized protein n=1 Tax=Mycena metata TaxID=1033252 RepID=A0AAD7IVH9_9AGAR|nr:hypothetical protein B0H16DRAFT_1419936 [Mycena metata]